jgi:hypothetical protein
MYASLINQGKASDNVFAFDDASATEYHLLTAWPHLWQSIHAVWTHSFLLPIVPIQAF